VALDAQGRPVVAWNEGGALFVQRFDGENWVALGHSGGAAGVAQLAGYPSLLLDSSGRPVVAWLAPDTRLLHVARFDGSRWTGLDGAAIAPVSSDAVDEYSLTGDRSATPAVAWSTTRSGSSRVYVRQFASGAWQTLEDSGAATGVGDPTVAAEAPALALDPAGLPVVTWLNGKSTIYVKRWTGAAWQELGASASGAGLSGAAASQYGRPEIAIDAAGRIAVAWLQVVPWSLGDFDHVHLKRWSGSAWEELGGSATGLGLSTKEIDDSREIRLNIDESDELWVGWNEPPSGANEMSLRRWSAGSWQTVSGPRAGSSPSLAVRPASSPVLGWVTDADVYVARRVSGSWTGFGNPVDGGGLKIEGGAVDVLRLTSRGDELVVGWRERTGSNVAYGRVHRWSDGGWIDLGVFDSSDVKSPPHRFDLALDPGGSPVALWSHRANLGYSNAFSYVSLRRFDATWSALAEPLALPSAEAPSFAMNDDGRPLLSYQSWQSGGRSRFTLNSWEDAGWRLNGSFVETSSAEETKLLRDSDGTPVLAWRESSSFPVHVRRFADGGWEDLGSLGANVKSFAAGLSPEGKVTVVWQTSFGQLGLAYRDGASWLGFGGSELARGIGSPDAGAAAPSLAFDHQGRPIVAFTDESTGRPQIYLRRWNGSNWVEHRGSASGGGVSNSRASPDLSSVVVTSGAICVTWKEAGSGGSLVLVRCSAL
jgi:hypothetical protein